MKSKQEKNKIGLEVAAANLWLGKICASGFYFDIFLPLCTVNRTEFGFKISIRNISNQILTKR